MAATPDIASSQAASFGRASDFVRWWRGEISRMLPERLALLGGAGATPLLLIEADEAIAIDPRDASGGAEKRATLAGLDEPRRRAAVRSLLEGIGETRNRARAALRHDEALVRRATLPAATEENLAQVLAFEMDRLSPFNAAEVYFDQRVVSRDPATGQIVVELAIARREAVDARVRELRALGVSVQGVALRDDATRSAQPFDLLPSEQRGARETPNERLARNGLIALVLIMFVATLVYPVWRKREAVTDLLPVVEKARQEAQATDAVVRELERQAADYNFLLARKHAWYPTAAYIEELSRIMPDHTWLQQLDIRTVGKTREIVITGETVSSSKLIELLEQSKMFQNTSPKGPTTRGSVPGSERFMIGGELRPRTAPEAQPLASAIKAAPPQGSNAVVVPAPVNTAPAPASVAPAQGATAVAPPVGANSVSAPPPSNKPNNGFGPFPKK
jgi:general secretion pathway protein L